MQYAEPEKLHELVNLLYEFLHLAWLDQFYFVYCCYSGVFFIAFFNGIATFVDYFIPKQPL